MTYNLADLLESVVDTVPERESRATGALEAKDVQRHCRARLASYKVPRDLVCVDEVLRTAAGKADYRWARDVAKRALGPEEA